jgi:hypothetical protein
MRRDRKVAQVILRSWGKTNFWGKLLPTRSEFTALSFNPSLKRVSIYNNFVKRFGDYSEYSEFRTLGRGAGVY